MYLGQRVIHGTTDYSREVNDWRTGSKAFAYTSGGYLYIGSDVPFNNLYIDLGTTKNAVSAVVSAQMWWAQAWTDAVDVIDETLVSGVSLAQSGRITFRPSDLKGWDSIPRTNDVSALSTYSIYDFYWARLSWNATLTSTTDLKYIGQKFSEDGDLFVYYPDLNSTALLTAHASGKTNWNDQHFAAAEVIIRSLMSKNIVWSKGQILDASRFVEASIHKTAEIIYSSFGSAYANNKTAAAESYKSAINMGRFAIDLVGEAKLEKDVKRNHTMWQTR